jgi:hypothetical protein
MGANTLILLLVEIYASPKKLQSNFVRDNSYGVARLASLGLISTAINGTFGHHWRVTYKGLRLLDYGDDE